jgi:hypothetical protein
MEFPIETETCRSCLEQKDARYQFPLASDYRNRPIIELIEEITGIQVRDSIVLFSR